MDVNSITVKFLEENELDCRGIIVYDWNKIPSLNTNNLQDLLDGHLVRFKGMVQDMYDPEYYLEKFEVKNTASSETRMCNGKYTDGILSNDKDEINNHCPQNVLSQRQTFVVISIPGVNKWAEALEIKTNKTFKSTSASTSPLKFNKDSSEDVEDAEASTSDTKTKRSVEDVEMEETVEPSTSSKKHCTTSTVEVQPSLISQEYLLNFPLPNRSGKACHLKVYDKYDDIKLNEIIECVGFLSLDLGLSCLAESTEEFDAMEMQTHHPPPSLIPRIHCVEFRKIEMDLPCFDISQDLTMESAKFLRKELHIVLTQLLLGDELAAEYLIYHLISRIYARRPLMALGKFSLNLSNLPIMLLPNYGEQLYKFIEELVPKSHRLDLTLENLNTLTFIPKKDFVCNRITSGLLQLSASTHLVLNECKLTTGRLEPTGVEAVSALSNITERQEMIFDFVYHKLEFNCDIPILSISEGKSLIPIDFHVRVQPNDACVGTFDEILQAAKVFLKPELLDAIRHYLAAVRYGEYELSDNLKRMIETDFVGMRQQGRGTSEDLHNLLVLARLVCLSEGKTELDEVCWKRTCQLEFDRKSRIINNRNNLF